MRLSPSRRIVAGLAFVLAGTSSSLAADAQAFADRLKAVMAEQKVTLEIGNAASEGEDVLLSGVELRGEGPEQQPVSVGELRFENVTGSTADGWRAERVAPTDIDRTDETLRTRISGMVVEGLQIEGTNATQPALTPIYFDRAAIDSITAERDGQPVLTIDTMSLVNSGAEAGGYNGTFGVERFVVNTQGSGGGGGAAVMNELGYAQLTGGMTGNASWAPDTGKLTLDPLQVAVEDAGTLDFSYTITGYTPSFIQSLSQLGEQMRQTEGQSQGAGMAMIGLISQLYLQSAELSFQDSSLTNRLLDYYAKQANQTREQMVEGLVGSLPLALAYLQNPDFQAKVTEAVRNFLENPQTLRIAIAPQAPVPATQIIGAAMGAPQTLPQVLNLSVEAAN